MKFLPRENITYKTKLSQQEVLTRLSKTLQAEKTFRFFTTSGKSFYEGEIKGQTFSIKRAINYKNSFLPQIKGTVQKDFDGTSIEIKMRLHVFVIGFICVWCAGVGLAFLACLSRAINKAEFEPVVLGPLGMLLLLYLMVMFAFVFESSKAKKDLQQLFEAEIIDTQIK